MKKLMVGIVVLGLLMAGAAFAQADKVVASVNGERITDQAFITILKARYGDRTLNAMISDLAIRQAAKAAGVTVGKDELDRRYLATYRAIEMRAPMTGENFEFWLAKQSLTKEYFATELYDQMLLEKMVEKQVKVTAEDVSGYYQRNKDNISDPATVRIAHICVKTDKEAQAIRADLLAGKITWEDAVKKYTLDPWTKDNGGDMGFIALSDTDFHKAAFALKANGDISLPVQSPMGFHLLKRLEFKDARIPKFEEVEATIRDGIARRQLKEYARQKRDEILKNAKIENVEKLPVEGPPPAAAPATPAPAP
jgi:foldase protein PrsA